MADPVPGLIEISEGLALDEVSALRMCLMDVAGMPKDVLVQSDIPLIAPAMLLGHSSLTEFAAAMMPSDGLSMVHESQSFSRLAPLRPDTCLSIVGQVSEKGAAKVFDFEMQPGANANLTLGTMQTRLREVARSDMTRFKGSNFPAHMDKGDVVWMWSQPFSRTAVQFYLALARDPNPIHVSDADAQAAGLDGAVVPGMFFAGVAEYVLLQAVPGAVLQDMKLRFMAPVLVGQALKYGVLVRKHTDQGQAKTVRIFILRKDNVIAAIADLELLASA